MPLPLSNRRLTRLVGLTLAVCAGLVASVLPAAPAKAQGAAAFVFEGAGWGHGVGMSQNGARNMADNGYEHTGILNNYYPNTIVTSYPTLDEIRVHIGDAARVELSSAGSITFERGGVAINAIPSGSITVSAHDGGLQVGNAWTTGSPSDPLFVSFPQPVKVANNGHRYLWGKFQLTNKDGKVRVVERLPLEQYVAGISEMPAAWPLEALMAQAIAARTYAHEVTLHRRNSDEWAQEYDISGTTIDQNYIGWDAQDSAWDQKWLAAVQATAGVEIVDNSGPIRAYYSASNGGFTETAAYVFGNDVPYTVAEPDPFDAGGHNWTTWTRQYSQGDVSRWLNASADTAVGTLQKIDILGGAGASARLDKAVVELVGSGGSKRVTGKRLMLAINAGVFGEGGGLSTHLPGTFTTIGNGASAGPPKPGGIEIPATVTPDPVDEAVEESTAPTTPDGRFVPPADWKPIPGTGVPPIRPSDSDPDEDPADSDGAGDTADSDTSNAGADAGSIVPPPGWTPVPGTGVPPVAAAAPGDADDTSDDAGDAADAGDAGDSAETDDGGVTGSSDFVPPPGWKPTPGTGVPPVPVAGAVAPAYVPPTGWEPTPGTGVPPGSPVTPTDSADADQPDDTSADTDEVDDKSTADAPRETSDSGGASTADTDAPAGAADSGSAAIADADAGSVGAPDASPTVVDDRGNEAVPAAASIVVPDGWTPIPGTGVPPVRRGEARSVEDDPRAGSLASALVLVTRSDDGDSDGAPATTFEVLSPSDELADEARERLQNLQVEAAIGLFAEFDIEGYIATVAPRPVHGICAASEDGVTCIPLGTYRALREAD